MCYCNCTHIKRTLGGDMCQVIYFSIKYGSHFVSLLLKGTQFFSIRTAQSCSINKKIQNSEKKHTLTKNYNLTSGLTRNKPSPTHMDEKTDRVLTDWQLHLQNFISCIDICGYSPEYLNKIHAFGFMLHLIAKIFLHDINSEKMLIQIRQ